MSKAAIFFLHGDIHCHTFAWYALPCQTPFCQAALLLPPLTQQQHVMEYWWDGSASTIISPTSTSDVMDQCNKIEDITFGAALIIIDCGRPLRNLHTFVNGLLQTFFFPQLWQCLVESAHVLSGSALPLLKSFFYWKMIKVSKLSLAFSDVCQWFLHLQQFIKLDHLPLKLTRIQSHIELSGRSTSEHS